MAVTNFDVQPFSVLPGLNAFSEGVDALAAQKEKNKAEVAANLKQQELMKAIQSGDPAQIFDFVSKNPGSSEYAGKMTGFVNDTTKQSAINSAVKVLTQGADPVKTMLEHADLVVKQGGDASETLGITETVMRDPSMANKQALATLALHAPEKYKAYMDATGAQTPEYTNITETKNGKKVGINKATGKYEIIQSEGIDFASPSDIPPAGTQEFNQLVEDATGDDEVRAKAARIKLGMDPRAVGSASQTIASEGTTEQVAESEAEIAATAAAATDAIAMSTEAIKRLEPIRTKIANYDEAIRAIDSGAGTGVIKSFFPSIKTASIELDNARGFMGLDIIGGTTFGALSESELAFALDTALPTKLEGPELRAWIERKKAAQMKLSQELEKAAIYLGKPGNTPAGYLEFQRNSGPQEVTSQAQFDALKSGAEYIEDGQLYRKP